jgi:hypothetical protein
VTRDIRIELPRPRSRDVEHGNPLFREYFNTLWASLERDVNRVFDRETAAANTS